MEGDGRLIGAGNAMDLAAQLDEDFRAALDSIPPLDLSDIGRARRERMELAEAARQSIAPNPDILIQDRLVDFGAAGRVRLRCYRRKEAGAEALPALLWFHRGGHVLGTVEQDDPHLERVVAEVDCQIFSVDWPRTPEHPYPAAIDTGYAALGWLFDNAETIGVPRRRIAVGGTSSGGGLAAGLCLLARDRGRYRPCFQWLFYPMLDDRNQSRSSHEIQDPRVWNRTSNLIAWASYLGPLANAGDVAIYAAPARSDDLSDLPPTFIGTGALDLFVDENIDYAQRLLAANVSTELLVYPRAIHGFDSSCPKRICRSASSVTGSTKPTPSLVGCVERQLDLDTVRIGKVELDQLARGDFEAVEGDSEPIEPLDVRIEPRAIEREMVEAARAFGPRSVARTNSDDMDQRPAALIVQPVILKLRGHRRTRTGFHPEAFREEVDGCLDQWGADVHMPEVEDLHGSVALRTKARGPILVTAAGRARKTCKRACFCTLFQPIIFSTSSRTILPLALRGNASSATKTTSLGRL